MPDFRVEIVPVEAVSGLPDNPTCELEGCNSSATVDVIAVYGDEPEYGYTSCDSHSASIAESMRIDSTF